jgi:hypothetical protein
VNRSYSFVYVVNIVFQAIFTLLFHIGSGLLLSWVLVEKLDAPAFTYAILIILSVMIGLISMIKFILASMNALTHLEKSYKEKRRKNGDQK